MAGGWRSNRPSVTFEGATGGELWRPGLFIQIVALGISAAAVVVLVFLSRRFSRAEAVSGEAVKEGPQDGMGAFENDL